MPMALDLYLEARRLLREKSFTGLVIGTLTLGIGAAAAVFSTLYAVVLRPFPYAKPESLVAILSEGESAQDGMTSMGDFVDWRSQARSFAGMAVMGHGSLVLAGGEGRDPEEIPTAAVSPNLFDVLGVQPILGRGFLPEEETPGRDQVVLLGYSLWQTRFGKDPGIIGKTLKLSGAPYVVVGVLPPDFQFLRSEVGFWSPMAVDLQKLVRKRRGLNVVARLRPGVTFQQAQDEMAAIARRQAERYPEANSSWRARVVPLSDRILGSFRAPLLLLACAAGLLLLTAWINVSHLVLARALARGRESAICSALGAGRWRVFRGLLIENSLLSAAGCLGSLLLARWLLAALAASSPQAVPRIEQAKVDLPTLAFALAAAGIIAIALSGLSALRISPDVTVLLKVGGKATAGPGQRRGREVLVMAQVAVALWLLVVSGLLVQSFVRLLRMDPGFDPSSLVVASFLLPLDRYPDAGQQLSFFRRVTEQIESNPSVVSTALSSAVPFNRPALDLNLELPFTTDLESRDYERRAEIRLVIPGYFRTLGIPLAEGRDFDAGDRQNAPLVAIVNEELAKHTWKAKSRLGNRLHLSYRGRETCQVVGVVGNVRHYGLDEQPRPEIYLPFRQFPTFRSSLVIRTHGPRRMTLDAVHEIVREIDPEQIVTLATMEDNIARSLAPRRFTLLLLIAFAAASTMLTLVGVHGLMAQWVARSRAEIGVRMAFGATPSTILRSVLSRGLIWTGVGLFIGLIVAIGTVRFLRGFLYGISPADLTTFFLASLFLLLAASLSCLVPARAAMRLSPVAALRYE
jgi:putative ABC transport system permease protein